MSWRFGSHVSVAGGLDRGVARGVDLGCDCLQIFTKNANRWVAKPNPPEAITSFRFAADGAGLTEVISHASYLINLAAPSDELWQKSIDAMVDEVQRAISLGLRGVVVHPGAFTTGDEASGLDRIVDGLTAVVGKIEWPAQSPRILLENTAGQGSCLGHDLSQLRFLIDHVDGPTRQRLGVCLDTCHAHAAGYDLATADGLERLTGEINGFFAPQTVAALHLNDSKKPAGSRVDRHEHIGRGTIGQDGWRRILASQTLQEIPGYLETEKGIDSESGEDWDAINLRELRRLGEST